MLVHSCRICGRVDERDTDGLCQYCRAGYVEGFQRAITDARAMVQQYFYDPERSALLALLTNLEVPS